MEKRYNTPELKQFIRKNSNLFWYIPDEKKEDISLNLLVETILNYGDEKSIKKLFDLLGIHKVAEIFYMQTSRKRVNYHKRVVHFFNLYFKRHAQRDLNKGAT